MPVQATIAITPGAGQFLDAVSMTIGPNLVVRETMVVADPTSPTELAAVSGGALSVFLPTAQITTLTPPSAAAIGTAVATDLLIGTQVAGSSVPVALPAATITTLTPPTASAIAAAIVANPPAVTISGTVGVTQSVPPWVIVGNKTHNNAAPGATNIGALVGIANVAAPTYTEGDQVLLSTDLTGALRVNIAGSVVASNNITQWNSVSLGSPSAYGTGPGAVNVIGVNAFITNTVPVSGTIAATQSGTWTVGISAAQTIAVTNAGTFAVQAAQSGTWNIGTVSAVTAITNALPAGSNVIGHVITDTGSTTAVTQATAASLNATVVGTGTFVVQATLSAGSAVIGHVIVDSGTITAVTSITNPVAVTGTFFQSTQPVSIASGQVASGAFASGSIAAGAIAASAAAAGAFPDGSVFVRSNAAATFPVTATIAAAQTIAVTNAGTFAVQATIAAAQKIEVYDGTNTATVKAASTAALPTDTALVVTEPGSTTAGACANTAVTNSSSTVLSANTARRELMIVNTDVVAVYLGLGQTPSATAYHIALAPCTLAHDGTGGSFISDSWQGVVNAIVASTTGHVAITEVT